jgi:hypothetical protein
MLSDRVAQKKSKHQNLKKKLVCDIFYATLAYIRHFTLAGCYDNDPWYLVTNLARHLDLAGFYFLNAPHLDLAGFYFLNAPLMRESPSLIIMNLPGLEHAPTLLQSCRSINEQ